jgi:hypothetical protein
MCMAVYTEPLESQPEFDDLPPLTAFDRAFLRAVRPLVGIYQLFTMPVHMYRSHRRPRGYPCRPAAIDEWTLPATARQYFEDAERTLSSLGFGGARREVTPPSPAARSYLAHLFNPTTRELASVIIGIVPRRLTQTLVGFRTWWEDGRQIVTSNTEQAELWASLHRPRDVDALALPGVEDLRRLYAIHRARCAERREQRPLGGGWDDPVHNPMALLRRTSDELDRRLLESGLFRIESDQFMRLTVKGAILMSWSGMQPFASYLAWQGRRRTAAALQRYSSPGTTSETDS